MAPVFNLAEQLVIAEIDNVLASYPYHPYQKAFAIPSLRQKLITYVLNRISSVNNADAKPEAQLLKYELSQLGLEQKRYIEVLIHQGVYYILQEQSDWLSRSTFLKWFRFAWKLII